MPVSSSSSLREIRDVFAGSACDECARNGIIENEGGRCTVCGEVANPEELIPYRLFRDKVS